MDRYGLLTSTDTVVFGAGYTAVSTKQWCLTAMALVTLTLAGAVGFRSSIGDPREAVRLLCGFVTLRVIAIGLLPWIVQGFVVEPNELSLEEP